MAMNVPTAAQLQKLAIIRNERYASRAAWFAMVQREIGCAVASNKHLTYNQASHLLTVLDGLTEASNA